MVASWAIASEVTEIPPQRSTEGTCEHAVSGWLSG